MPTLADYANAKRQQATMQAMSDYAPLARITGDYGEFLTGRLGEMAQGWTPLPKLSQLQAGEVNIEPALEVALDQVVPQAKIPGMLAMMAKRLPMDEASRMARAREMGFNVDQPLYHGTATDFAEFDPDRAIGSQFWTTSDRAAVEAGEVGAQGRGVIKELYSRVQNPAGWEEYDKFGIDELIARGYDGIKLPESGGTFTMVAFDPSQYRDVRAAFDPAKKKSANLLAGMAGLGVALPAGYGVWRSGQDRGI